MKIGILGGGLGGISLAYFLQNNDKIKKIEILEKENEPGGLCRSFTVNGINYDIGPHVIFSKDVETLELMINILGENKNKIRRSNKIYYKERFIKYPFENELSALPEADRNYCLKTFLDNPYENDEAKNLLQYFMKTFGEGMTNIYFKPYNNKIWKYDIALMDTQMMERIPKPPREDIIKSASGESTEGYLHQLYFYYPRQGGINALVKAFQTKLNDKVNVVVNSKVVKLQRYNGGWKTTNDHGVSGNYDIIISTVPVPSLIKIYNDDMPEEIVKIVDDLKYNSIIVAVINVDKDHIGNHFAVMIPDEDIMFHRVSKLNFLGDTYRHNDSSTTLMVEITYVKNDHIDKMSITELKGKIIEGLKKVNFIEEKTCIHFMEIKKFEYAYVIYDLNHKHHMGLISRFFSDAGIRLCGRFGEFEYLNMDHVIRHAKALSKKIQTSIYSLR